MKSWWMLRLVRTLLSLFFLVCLHQRVFAISISSGHNFFGNDSAAVSGEHSGLVSTTRTKRQWGGGYCPPNCFQCNYNQCNQMYQPRCMPLVVNCCCPPQTFDIKTACDGDEAVAGCMNGLCGQGYYCTRRQFCCRCPNGKSLGSCINGMCPAGYACNANNYCCAVGAGAVLGKCVNGLCPAGYACGAGDLCYAKSTGMAIPRSAPVPQTSKPVIRSRNKPPSTRKVKGGTSPAGTRRTKAGGKGGKRRKSESQVALLNSKQGSFLNHPIGSEEGSWVEESGDVVLYDDYEGEKPFLEEELSLINAFNAGQQQF